ncbi:MAG: endonuclease/exonuclease/phosphatase family protein [Bacillota bacterium]
MISIATWNMDYWKRNKEQRQAAWDYLTDEIRPDIALLQECMPPSVISKGYNIIYREIGGTRNWGSAVLARGYPIKEIDFENSHPGCVVATEVEVQGVTLTAISVYGMLCRYNYATTTMHRILSDLTPLIHGQRRSRTFIMGGDYNVSPQWDERYKHRDPSHQLVFDRIDDFRLVNCTLQYFGKLVQTNHHSRSKFPWQNDFLHASKKLAAKLVSCRVFNEEHVREFSDHDPVVAYFED